MHIDYHIHTHFSDDSTVSMEAYCCQALDRGITEIAFTDHCNFFIDDNPPGVEIFDTKAYFSELEQCRHTYGNRLTIRAGVELGESHLFKDEVETFLKSIPFDFVIGSIHHSKTMKAAWRPEYFEQPVSQVYTEYFEHVVDLSNEGDFDVLGHLDVIKRDAFAFSKQYPGHFVYEDLIRTVLKNVIQRGKGIEINTSPLRKNQNETCPSLQILHWFYQMGGEILTIGSDSHCECDIGSHCKDAITLAKNAGFTRIATFTNRNITWISI